MKLYLKNTLSICILVLVCSSSICLASNQHQNSHSLYCNKADIPKIIKPMENWDIIATNTATINASTIFGGNELIYSISVHPKNRKNIVTINKYTGIIRVIANKEDNFNIVVKAKNKCGAATNKFNIEIDEEE